MEKKVYEEPSVKKVEFEFNERIASSNECSGEVTSDEGDDCLYE